MPDNSRRAFLKTASVGLAAAGVAAAAPVAASAAPASSDSDAGVSGPVHAGPVLAHVENVHSGRISVLAGEHEVVHHDPALARQLARLAAQAARA